MLSVKCLHPSLVSGCCMIYLGARTFWKLDTARNVSLKVDVPPESWNLMIALPGNYSFLVAETERNVTKDRILFSKDPRKSRVSLQRSQCVEDMENMHEQLRITVVLEEPWWADEYWDGSKTTII